MNCKVCGTMLKGRERGYCGIKCREKAKTGRRRVKREGKIEQLLLERGGICEDCGYDGVGSLLFYHPKLSGSCIAKLLINRISEETLEVLNECKIVCRNCQKEK